MVAARDIGLLAAQVLVGGPSANHVSVIDLESPREVAPRDVAEAAARVLGRAVEAEFAPDSAMESALVGFGFSADVARHMRALTVGINSGKVGWENRGEKHVRGTTDVETVVRALLGAKK